jgi:maltose O-acetyltransferase
MRKRTVFYLSFLTLFLSVTVGYGQKAVWKLVWSDGFNIDGKPEPDFFVEPPFYCDYGDGIYAGEGVFINFGVVILDGAKVTIGKKTFIAPGVHIYTAQHQLDADEREMYENCLPVTIGEHCWIGGQTTICPGVTIGNRCVIGAGAVVTRDIPNDSLTVGNPAKVIRKLNSK